MKKKPFDANLPDLIRGLLQSLDPALLEQLGQQKNNIDPQVLKQQLDQLLRMWQQNFGGPEGQALAQIWQGIMDMAKQK